MGTEARYDAVADFYEAGNPDSYEASPDVALFELAGSVDGLLALDLACGQGRISRELARRGAAVVGVDLSTALITKARAAEQAAPLGVSYVEGDVASTDMFPGETFDVATCHFGLSDIDDLDGTLATVARVVRPTGRFVFTILHPCFPGWGSDVAGSWPPGGYFEERWWTTAAARSTLRQQVGANHRTLSTYLNSLNRHGLVVEQAVEPPPPTDWTESAPDRAPVPTFLVARCRHRGD